MREFRIGANGALCIDEKMNIRSLHLPFVANLNVFENMLFAISDDKGNVRVLEDFTTCKCKQAFLGASYKFSDKNFSAKINAWALTPFGFGKDSHLPAAMFSFKIKNDSKKKRTYHFAVLAENFLTDTLNQTVAEDGYCGLLFGSASALSTQAEYLTHSMLMEGSGLAVRYVSRDDTKTSFLKSVASGEFEELDYTMPAQRDCGAIVRRLELEAGQSEVLRFVYTWHAPNVLIEESDETYIMKNVHACAHGECLGLGTYVLQNWESLFAFSKKMTDGVRECLDSKTFERAAFDNFETIVAHAAYKLSDYGNARMFYKNRFGAPELYLRQDTGCLYPASVYFDFDSEVDEITWALEYCFKNKGHFTGAPAVKNGNLLASTADAVHIAQHLSPIWRVYRLYKLSKDASYIELYWDCLKEILNYVRKSKLVRNGEVLINAQPDNVYMTNCYILSLMCMEKMAVVLNESNYAQSCAELASNGKAFVKRNLFNGKFYNRQYPTEEDLGACCILQTLPAYIGATLGLEILDVGQSLIANENIYVLNFDEAKCAVKSSSDAEVYTLEEEALYAQILLMHNREYLASLVCKAQQVRCPDLCASTQDGMLVQAMFPNGYDADSGELYISKRGMICFAKDSVIMADGGKCICVEVLGNAIAIKKIRTEKGTPVRVTYGEMDLMYTIEEDSLVLNSPLTLCEGQALTLYSE